MQRMSYKSASSLILGIVHYFVTIDIFFSILESTSIIECTIIGEVIRK